MAIKSIDYNLCQKACLKCIDACPVDVFRLDKQGKVRIAYPDDCHSCLWCAMDCPKGAITVSPEDCLPWLRSFYP